MIKETFLPCIFFGNTKTLFPIVGYLSKMPFKKSGLGLLNPVTPEKGKYPSSQWGSAELIRSVTGEDHSPTTTTSGCLVKKCVTGRETRMTQTKTNARV